jgi:hypothetical protein
VEAERSLTLLATRTDGHCTTEHAIVAKD